VAEKTPLLSAPAGLSIVWSANTVTSKALNVFELLMKTATFSWFVIGGGTGPVRVCGLIGHLVAVGSVMHTSPIVVAWARGRVVRVMVGLTKNRVRKTGRRMRMAIFRFNRSLAS
jgi:hypothetical protein